MIELELKVVEDAELAKAVDLELALSVGEKSMAQLLDKEIERESNRRADENHPRDSKTSQK